MRRQGAIERLHEAVKCERVADTDRLAIIARLPGKFEAMGVVNELAAAFKTERERLPEAIAKNLADLDRQAVAQFDKLEDMARQCIRMGPVEPPLTGGKPRPVSGRNLSRSARNTML